MHNEVKHCLCIRRQSECIKVRFIRLIVKPASSHHHCSPILLKPLNTSLTPTAPLSVACLSLSSNARAALLRHRLPKSSADVRCCPSLLTLSTSLSTSSWIVSTALVTRSRVVEVSSTAEGFVWDFREVREVDAGLSVSNEDMDETGSGSGGNNGSVGGRRSLSQVFRSSCSLVDRKHNSHCRIPCQTYCWSFFSSSSILPRLAMFFGLGLKGSGWGGGSSYSNSQLFVSCCEWSHSLYSANRTIQISMRNPSAAVVVFHELQPIRDNPRRFAKH